MILKILVQIAYRLNTVLSLAHCCLSMCGLLSKAVFQNDLFVVMIENASLNEERVSTVCKEALSLYRYLQAAIQHCSTQDNIS